MSMTSNDRTWGPFVIGPWSKQFSLEVCSMSRYDDEFRSYLLLIGFGWAIKTFLPVQLKSHSDGPCVYGFSISDMGNGYDFVQVKYGPQTWDSSSTKAWCKHLPWKQWSFIRHSLYFPNGNHFFTEWEKDRKKGFDSFLSFYDMKEKCNSSKFLFKDYDGEEIEATCVIEEREWHKGEGWFKWLKYFTKPKISRSLDLKFSKEVGPEKGSWKGGTIGHSIEMKPNESPESAFRRYCIMDHERKGRKYNLTFIGQI